MKVKELIRKLQKYDPDKEVLLMREHKNADITFADEINKVQQKTLSRDAFEYMEFEAIVLIHNTKNN